MEWNETNTNVGEMEMESTRFHISFHSIPFHFLCSQDQALPQRGREIVLYILTSKK